MRAASTRSREADVDGPHEGRQLSFALLHRGRAHVGVAGPEVHVGEVQQQRHLWPLPPCPARAPPAPAMRRDRPATTWPCSPIVPSRRARPAAGPAVPGRVHRAPRRGRVRGLGVPCRQRSGAPTRRDRRTGLGQTAPGTPNAIRPLFRAVCGRHREESIVIAPPGGPSVSYTDRTLTCVDCSVEFIHSAADQEFYAEKGFVSDPKRCPSCRASRRAMRETSGYDTPRHRWPARLRARRLPLPARVLRGHLLGMRQRRPGALQAAHGQAGLLLGLLPHRPGQDRRRRRQRLTPPPTWTAPLRRRPPRRRGGRSRPGASRRPRRAAGRSRAAGRTR